MPATSDDTERCSTPDGRIVTVIAAKDGVGKTTLAVNIALALHALAGQRVCLVDLDLGFGDLAVALGLTAERNLGHWTTGGEDELANLAAVITPYQPGVDCVLAPYGSGDAMRLSPDAVVALLSTLQLHYDTVLVDTSTRHPALTLAALDCAHEQLVVAMPDRTGLRHLRFVLDALDLLGCSEATRSVVLNRWDDSIDLPSTEVSDTVRLPVAAYIPNSRDVAASVNRGTPLVSHVPLHPVSAAVTELVRDVLLDADALPVHATPSGVP